MMTYAEYTTDDKRLYVGEKMKGLSLSINVIIIIAIAVFVLAAVGVFFTSTFIGGISETEAQRLFANGCARYCQPSLYETFKNAYLASQNDQGFVSACSKLGYGPPINRCFEKCSNCNLKVTENDIAGINDNNVAITTRG